MPEQNTEESGKPSSSQPDQSTENSIENTAFEANEPPHQAMTRQRQCQQNLIRLAQRPLRSQFRHSQFRRNQ